MSYWLEKKYLNLLSPRIENFHWKSGNLANGRCPICHDSSTSSKKARLYFLMRDGHWQVYCHNCLFSSSFKKFLKRLDSFLFAQMQLEELKETGKPPPIDEDFKKFRTETVFEPDDQLKALNKLKKISQLPSDHLARTYVRKRLIPNTWDSNFRWCPDFNSWINDFILPGKFDKDALKIKTGRIVVPFFDKNNHFHALTARSLGFEKQLRYIHIVVDRAIPPIWGLDRVDLNQDTYVFEGIFDALFIPNSLAICGGNYNYLKQVVDYKKTIVCYDFEPRSKETIKKISQAIDEGFRVMIPPYDLPCKDINELILHGYSMESVEALVKQNVYSDLTARAKLSEWKRI